MASIFNFIHINKRRPLWLVRCFSWSQTQTSMYPRTVMAVTSSQTSQQHKYFIKLPSVYHSKPHLPRSLLSFPRRFFVWSHHHSFPLSTHSVLSFTPLFFLFLPSTFLSFSYHFPLISSPFLSSPRLSSSHLPLHLFSFHTGIKIWWLWGPVGEEKWKGEEKQEKTQENDRVQRREWGLVWVTANGILWSASGIEGSTGNKKKQWESCVYCSVVYCSVV